jgi:protein-tyrosine-phosphatase
MAEALARERSGGAVDACSAGSHPKPLHPNAVRVMAEEYGVDISGRTSQHLDVVSGQSFDWAITLCDKVREICPEFPGGPVAAHWSLIDPAAGGDDDAASYPAFVDAARQIDTRVEFLLADLADRANAA